MCWVYTIPATTLFSVVEYVIYRPARLYVSCMVADECRVLFEAGSGYSDFQKKVVEVPLLGRCTKHEFYSFLGNVALTQV